MRMVCGLHIAWLLASVCRADTVDDFVRAGMKASHIPGVSLAVVQKGRIVKAAGYGVANLEWSVPASENTVYEIGSISKQFAAEAILLLREDGKLNLDEPLSKYIAHTPAAWQRITIRHVLNHTAGLADFDSGKIGFSYRREYSASEFVELLGAQPLAFQPGERWNYTNAFPLIGIVVERAAGKPYMDFVTERIFKKLGLASARFKVQEEVVSQRAAGYLWKDGVYRHGEPLRPAIIAPNGGVMMSAVDFAKWDMAMTSGKILSRASLDEMVKPARLNNGLTMSHGLGWFVDTFAGHRFGAHWGSTVTGNSAVIRRYDEGLTVIMLANLDDGAIGIDAISKRIANHYLPGTAIQGLAVQKDSNPGETARIRKTIEEGVGVIAERVASAARAVSSLEPLGEENVGSSHFMADPAVRKLRRYRAVTTQGRRYFTVRLGEDGKVLGALVEE